MTITIEATYENGVLVPVQSPDLADHERVRLTVDAPPGLLPWRPSGGRRGHRIQIDPQLAKEIAESPEFLIEES